MMHIWRLGKGAFTSRSADHSRSHAAADFGTRTHRPRPVFLSSAAVHEGGGRAQQLFWSLAQAATIATPRMLSLLLSPSKLGRTGRNGPHGAPRRSFTPTASHLGTATSSSWSYCIPQLELQLTMALEGALSKKAGLTLAQLASYDDFVTDALVDRVCSPLM